MRASTLCLRASVLFAIVGLSIGIMMAASHDHVLAPAHAHVNLVGWVSTFLFGLFYRGRTALDGSRAALFQSILWILGTAVLSGGLVSLLLGNAAIEPVLAMGSFVLLAGMIWFAVLVWRATD